jgi:hypothetical protein
MHHTNVRRAPRRTRVVALLATLPLVLMACGSDDDSSSNTTAAPTTSAAPSTSGGATTTSAASTTSSGGAVDLDAAAVQYVGGKAQAATGSPIKIGVVNTNTGAIPMKHVTDAAQVAIDYANSHLNGINGHKIELAACDLNSDETGQSCGTLYANDPSISTIVMGLLPVGNQAFYKVIDNKKVMVQTVPIQAADFDPYPGNKAPNVFTLSAGVPGQVQGLTKYIATLNPTPKNVAIIALQNPGSVSGATALQAGLKARNVNATIVYLQAGAGSAAVASAIQAGGGDTADVWFPNIDPATCVDVYKYQQSAKIKPITVATGGCLGTGFKDVTGGGLMPDGWIQSDLGSSVLVPSGDPIELLAQRELKDVLATSSLPQYDAGMLLGIFNAIKAMNIAGEGADVDAISKVMRNLPGPIVENPLPVACGSIPNYPTLCGTGVGLIQEQGTQLVRLAPTAQMPIIDFSK